MSALAYFSMRIYMPVYTALLLIITVCVDIRYNFNH